MTEGVILLHGILRSKYSMSLMAYFFKRKDYKVLNLDYPSTKHSIEGIAESIHDEVVGFSKGLSKVHFVGYSLDGLVIHVYLNKYMPKNLGRVIMLGTPNNGSEIVDVLKDTWLFKKIFGLSGQQLITNNDKLRSALHKVDFELGVIAGICNYAPLSSLFIPQPHDGRVSVASTVLQGMKEHITIMGSHAFLPINKDAINQAFSFINTGRFIAK